MHGPTCHACDEQLHYEGFAWHESCAEVRISEMWSRELPWPLTLTPQDVADAEREAP